MATIEDFQKLDIEVRKANPDDIGKYTNLLQQTYQATYVDMDIGLGPDCFSRDVFASENTQRYLKSHLINTDIQRAWVAFDGNILIGAITCILHDSRRAELVGFYVHQEYQNKGIGRKLYNLALEFSSGRELILDTYAHNTKTISLYKKWGWELDITRGDGGYFYRHWSEWPEGLQAKCLYMILKKLR